MVCLIFVACNVLKYNRSVINACSKSIDLSQFVVLDIYTEKYWWCSLKVMSIL